jgi:hypothetical protein
MRTDCCCFNFVQGWLPVRTQAGTGKGRRKRALKAKSHTRLTFADDNWLRLQLRGTDIARSQARPAPPVRLDVCDSSSPFPCICEPYPTSTGHRLVCLSGRIFAQLLGLSASADCFSVRGTWTSYKYPGSKGPQPKDKIIVRHLTNVNKLGTKTQ